MRQVYRYIFPGSANNSILHTIAIGAENPEFLDRKPMERGEFDLIVTSAQKRALELRHIWGDLQRYDEPQLEEVNIADKISLKNDSAKYIEYASNVLADLEDAAAARMDFDQFTMVQSVVNEGWVYKHIPRRFEKIFKTRRDTSFVSLLYFVDVMAAAINYEIAYIRALRKFCPKSGIASGWNQDKQILTIYQIKW
jgi:hypothetical protein